ncbi:MAG: hypothetical protein RIR06_1264 [Bacteroidota bacterium]|jgi:hypothetical protein
MKKKETSSNKKKNDSQPIRILFPKKLEKANEILQRVGVPEQA